MEGPNAEAHAENFDQFMRQRGNDLRSRLDPPARAALDAVRRSCRDVVMDAERLGDKGSCPRDWLDGMLDGQWPHGHIVLSTDAGEQFGVLEQVLQWLPTGTLSFREPSDYTWQRVNTNRCRSYDHQEWKLLMVATDTDAATLITADAGALTAPREASCHVPGGTTGLLHKCSAAAAYTARSDAHGYALPALHQSQASFWRNYLCRAAMWTVYSFAVWGVLELVDPVRFRKMSAALFSDRLLRYLGEKEVAAMRLRPQAELYAMIGRVIDALHSTEGGRKILAKEMPSATDRAAMGQFRLQAQRIADGNELQSNPELLEHHIGAARSWLERADLWSCLSRRQLAMFPLPAYPECPSETPPAGYTSPAII